MSLTNNEPQISGVCELKLHDGKFMGDFLMGDNLLESKYKMAWYLYKDGEKIETKWYEPESSVLFSAPIENGVYWVTAFIKYKDIKKSIKSSRFKVSNRTLTLDNSAPKKGHKDSYSQQGEDLILKRILNRILQLPSDYKGLYVDIGCYHPTISSNTHLLHESGWQGINIDIQKESIDLFVQDRPDDVSLHLAVGDDFGEIPAFVNRQALSVTATCDPAVAGRQMEKNPDIEERKVKMVTLDWIMQEHNKEQSRIDFLDLDVEGFELNVLKGLNFDLYRPRVIAIEIHCPSLYDGIQSDVSKFLENKDYVCIASSVITFFFVSKRDIVR